MATRKVAVITLFPEMFRAIVESGITSRAIEQNLLELTLINPRQFTSDKHQTVDDRPYGGGPGMVMRVEPLAAALEASLVALGCSRQQARVIYLSPQGEVLNKKSIDTLLSGGPQTAANFHLVLVAGRYEGIDERFIEHYVDTEISIGDYVLSGGELPAMVLLDAIIRKLPGALGDAQSAEQDSFETGLLDCPHYTRPEEVLSTKVPDVLLSGDHKRIEIWRLQQSLGRTWLRRPELIEALELTELEQRLLDEYIRQHSNAS